MSLVSATVPADAGSVIVTSAVAAGPIKVTALVPLSVSSLKSIEPAALEEPVSVGAVKDLFVNVCVPARVATVASIFTVRVFVLLAVVVSPVPPAIVKVSEFVIVWSVSDSEPVTVKLVILPPPATPIAVPCQKRVLPTL